MTADPVDPSLTIQAVGALLRSPIFWLRSPIFWAYAMGIATGWSFARRATRYMIGGRL